MRILKNTPYSVHFLVYIVFKVERNKIHRRSKSHVLFAKYCISRNLTICVCQVAIAFPGMIDISHKS